MISQMREGEKRSETPWSRITAITVTYNSSAVIEDCLKSVGPAARVIVVDNASSDGTIARAEKTLPSVEIIGNDRNLGFGRANNIALELTDTEFALLINPDARMMPGSIEALVDAADLLPEGALFSPALFKPDGSRQFTHDVRYEVRRRLPRRRDKNMAFEGLFCTWSISGAVMLFRMTSMREIGFFDPNFFLYYEDSDLSARICNSGHSIIQEPRAVAEHAEGGSTRPSLRSAWVRNRHLTSSRLYFIEKHYRARAAWLDMAKMTPVYMIQTLAYGLRLRWPRAVATAARATQMIIWAMRRRARRQDR